MFQLVDPLDCSRPSPRVVKWKPKLKIKKLFVPLHMCRWHWPIKRVWHVCWVIWTVILRMLIVKLIMNSFSIETLPDLTVLCGVNALLLTRLLVLDPYTLKNWEEFQMHIGFSQFIYTVYCHAVSLYLVNEWFSFTWQYIYHMTPV